MSTPAGRSSASTSRGLRVPSHRYDSTMNVHAATMYARAAGTIASTARGVDLSADAWESVNAAAAARYERNDSPALNGTQPQRSLRKSETRSWVSDPTSAAPSREPCELKTTMAAMP